MREWCGCGASIRARRKDVLVWRDKHRHDAQSEPEPDKNGAQAQVETAWRPGFTDDSIRSIPDVQARIGFTPNGEGR